MSSQVPITESSTSSTSLTSSDSSTPPSPNLRSRSVPNLTSTNTSSVPITTATQMSSSHTNPITGFGSPRTPDMMPPVGNKSAPSKFKGRAGKVKDFIKRYDQLCSVYNVPPAERAERVIDYCSQEVTDFIEALSSYRNGNWIQLQKDILNYYDADLKEARYMPRDLRKLIRKWEKKSIKKLTKWRNYEREFITIAGWLEAKKRMTTEDVAAHFWQGIHRHLREIIENRLLAKSPKPDMTRPFTIKEITDTALVILERNRFDLNLAGSDYDRKHRRKRYDSDESDSDSDSDYDSDSELDDSSSDDSDESDDEEYTKRRSKKKTKTSKKHHDRKKTKDTSKSKSRDKKHHSHDHSKKSTNDQDEVEDLIEQLGKLSINDPEYGLLYYKALRLDPLVSRIVLAPNSQRRNQFQSNSNMNSSGNRPSRPYRNFNSGNQHQGPLTCFGCGETGHGLRDCSVINDFIRKGIIARTDSGRISRKDGQPIYREGDETFIQAIKRLDIRDTHFVTIKDNFLESDPDSEYYVEHIYNADSECDMNNDSEEEEEEEEAQVMAAERSQKKITSKRREVLDSVMMPSHQKKDKGKENTNPKYVSNSEPFKVRSGGPIEIIRADDPPIFMPEFIKPKHTKDDIVMAEPKSIPNRTKPDNKTKPNANIPDEVTKPTKAKPVGRQSELSAAVEENKVISNILDAPITLKIKEVLGTSPLLMNRFSDMMKPKNAKPTSSALALNSNIISDEAAKLIRLPLQIGNRHMTAIIDTGSELNILHKKVYESAISHLPIDTTKSKIMGDANGGFGELKGLVSNVPLICGSMIHTASFYIGAKAPFDILLGRPWQIFNAVTIDERQDGTYLIFNKPSGVAGRYEMRLATKEALEAPRHTVGNVRNAFQSLLTSAQVEPSEELDCSSCNEFSTHLLQSCPELDNAATVNPVKDNPNADNILNSTAHAAAHLCDGTLLKGTNHKSLSVSTGTSSCQVEPRPSLHRAKLTNVPEAPRAIFGPERRSPDTIPNLEFSRIISLGPIIHFWQSKIITAYKYCIFYLVVLALYLYALVYRFTYVVKSCSENVLKRYGTNESRERDAFRNKQDQIQLAMAHVPPVAEPPVLNHVVPLRRLSGIHPVPIPLPIPTNDIHLPPPNRRFTEYFPAVDIPRQINLIHEVIHHVDDTDTHSSALISESSLRLPFGRVNGNLVEQGILLNATVLHSQGDRPPVERTGHLVYTFYPHPWDGIRSIHPTRQVTKQFIESSSNIDSTRPNSPATSEEFDSRVSTSAVPVSSPPNAARYNPYSRLETNGSINEADGPQFDSQAPTTQPRIETTTYGDHTIDPEGHSSLEYPPSFDSGVIRTISDTDGPRSQLQTTAIHPPIETMPDDYRTTDPVAQINSEDPPSFEAAVIRTIGDTDGPQFEMQMTVDRSRTEITPDDDRMTDPGDQSRAEPTYSVYMTMVYPPSTSNLSNIQSMTYPSPSTGVQLTVSPEVIQHSIPRILKRRRLDSEPSTPPSEPSTYPSTGHSHSDQSMTITTPQTTSVPDDDVDETDELYADLPELMEEESDVISEWSDYLLGPLDEFDESTSPCSDTDESLPDYLTIAEAQATPKLAPSMLPNSDDPRVKYYEVYTQDTDSWAYNDAETSVLRQHGVNANQSSIADLPELIPSTGIIVPPLHPGDYPIRMRTNVIYTGPSDNHPLRYRDLQTIPRTSITFTPIVSDDERAIADHLIYAMKLMGQDSLFPIDNQHSSNSFRRNVGELERPRLRYLFPFYSPSFIQTSMPDQVLPEPGGQPLPRDSLLLKEALTKNHLTNSDNLLDDEEDYWSVDYDRNIDIRLNIVNPSLPILRLIRRHTSNAIRLLAALLLTVKWRNRVDAHAGDTRHYFYFHCHIFRYLESRRQILYQGFYANCTHYDNSTSHRFERKPFIPINPFISIEEDEFLAQAAKIMELEYHGEFTNIIRLFRGRNLPHSDSVRLLFDHCYLDPIASTDHHGGRYAVVWKPSDL